MSVIDFVPTEMLLYKRPSAFDRIGGLILPEDGFDEVEDAEDGYTQLKGMI